MVRSENTTFRPHKCSRRLALSQKARQPGFLISGTTKLVGLLGWPVEHTMSPVIHNTAFAAAGLDYVYVPLPVKPSDVAAALTGLKALGFAGVNVTVPHKISVMNCIEKCDRSAELVGAVNTVVFQDGVATGYNTDMAGFINSLAAQKVTISGKNAVLLGAGGAARAVVCGLLEGGIGGLVVGAREERKAVEFVACFADKNRLAGCDWQKQSFAQALAGCDILINCTPVGMYPHQEEAPLLDWDALNPGAAVCDLIYNPPVTSFLAQAAARGHKIVGGAGMLVEQGALAFSLWTGAKAPTDVMYEALDKVLADKCR